MSVQITLACCTCGASRPVVVAEAPTFAFELFDPAKAVGFLCVFDIENARSLIFCSADCRNIQITKQRRFRKRLINTPARPVAAVGP